VAEIYPRIITHVGVTVTDLDKAIRWYGEILGFPLLAGPADLVADDSHFGQIARDVFGSQFRRGRLALLRGSNGVSIELFQFDEPTSTRQADNFEYWKASIMHFTVVDPDLEALVKKIAETGGKARGKVWTLFPGKPYKMAYCEDPFGNIIEIYTHSTEQTWSNI
jgi:catechol 2,3-dioxygenase-like lactoylglutathione lyase family enzyme